jgi:hypothetical protein
MTTERLERKPPRKQEEAIAALLIHPTVEAAAAAVGVSVDSLNRWQRDEAFASAYREARSAVVRRATTTLSTACASAVETLSDVMTGVTYPAHCRIQAARMVLDYAHRGLELLDLSARVAALEEEARHGK